MPVEPKRRAVSAVAGTVASLTRQTMHYYMLPQTARVAFDATLHGASHIGRAFYAYSIGADIAVRGWSFLVPSSF